MPFLLLRRRALAGLCLVLVACAHRGKPGEPPVVGEISIEGNEVLEDGEIRSRLVLSESGRRFLDQPFEFRSDLLKADARRIERLYAANGYFLAKVTDTRFSEKNGRVDVTFFVDEGSPARVRQLEVKGLEQVPERGAVLQQLPLREGEVFDEAAYERLKATIRERLRARGYAQAEVKGQVLVDRTGPSAKVTVEVDPGLQYRISRVHVFGAQSVSRSRVAEATRLEQGQLFTPDALTKAQLRVYALGVFSLVRVEAGAFDARTKTVPVVVEVTEAPFINVEAGAGAELDSGRTARTALRARGRVTHRNLGRGLQRLSVNASAGWAWVPGVLAFLNEEGTRQGFIGGLGAEYTQPQIGRSPFDLVAGSDLERDVTPAFEYARWGVNLAAPFRPVRELTISPGLRFNWYFGIDAEAVSSGDVLSTAGCGPRIQSQPVTEIDTECRLLAAELLVNLDLRDDPINTRSGFFATLTVQRAFSVLSEFKYWRVSPDLRGYVPLTRSLTLAGRLHYGALLDVGEPGDRQPPGVARFFAGGANSLRGTGAQQLGPSRFVVLPNGDAEPGDPRFIAGAPVPLGGDRLLEGSLELRWQVNPEWSVALFTDAGALTLGLPGATPFATSEIVMAAGVGVRWRSPVGPIRADLGRRFVGLSKRPRELELRVESEADYVATVNAEAPGVDPKDPNAYRIALDCSGTTPPWFCYEEGLVAGLQFWITVGEAF